MTTIKKGNTIITDFRDYVINKDPDLIDQIQVQAGIAQMSLHDIHARAMACHCECLGMNAENAIAACNGTAPPYTNIDYLACMHKWEVVNEKGHPII